MKVEGNSVYNVEFFWEIVNFVLLKKLVEMLELISFFESN